jgi:hypothetical protein
VRRCLCNQCPPTSRCRHRALSKEAAARGEPRLCMPAMDHPDDDRAADSDWLRLTVAPEGQMTERGWAVLRSLRVRLSELSPVRLVPSETWSVAFPRELVLVLPLHSGHRVSFQILVGQNDVTGEWQDAHYAWRRHSNHPEPA